MLYNLRLVNPPIYARRLLYATIMAGLFTTALPLFAISIGIKPAIGQIQETPSLPIQGGEEDDISIDIESQTPSVSDSATLTTNASNIPPPMIEITSHEDGQEVPVGELTIEGASSDDQESNCQVYADVNDMTPMQNATAAGNIAEDSDFSKWTFTYTQDYQLITEGSNELTAKISCFNADHTIPMSKWHSVNVTGISTGTGTATEKPAGPITSPLAINGTATSAEETVPDTDNGKAVEDESMEELSPGVPPTG